MCLSRDSEEGGGMLLLAWMIPTLQDWDEVFFDRIGRGWLTWWLTHSLGVGVVFAVEIAAEVGMLESVLAFGGMDVGFRGTIEADGLSFDDVGIRRGLGQTAVGDVICEAARIRSSEWVKGQ